MSLNSYNFDDVYRYYDEERRERSGCYRNTTSGEVDEKKNKYNFNYVQHLTLDYDQNPQHDIQILSYANGIKFIWKSEYTGDSNNEHIISGNIHVYDKNNNDITTEFTAKYPRFAAIKVKSCNVGDSQPLSAITFDFYNMFWYSGGDHPDTLYIGEISTHKNNSSPYDPPELSGLVDITNYSTYYNDNYGMSFNSDTQWDEFIDAIEASGDGTPITPILPSDDTSEPGGGDIENPDYNPFSDPIDFPGLPTGGSSIATGFVRVYTPTVGQLNGLAGVLWGDDFVDTIKKIQNDPMEAIISLHSVPFGIVGSNAECRIGNFNTGITMPAVSAQFYTINLGSITIPEHWASALDYSPYVSIDLYIPFCGVVSVQVDDIIGRTISVKMNVDIIGGEALISVMCGNSVLYTYNTNVILRHPISQSSFGPLYQSVLGMLGSTASGFASGGIGGAVGGAIGGALNVAVSKQHAVSRGGSIGGATGVLGTFTPYLIIHRPIQSLAEGFAHFKGYPSNITTSLGSVTGYTEVESVHLNGITCTDAEKAEIEALLYNGVIL